MPRQSILRNDFSNRIAARGNRSTFPELMGKKFDSIKEQTMAETAALKQREAEKKQGQTKSALDSINKFNKTSSRMQSNLQPEVDFTTPGVSAADLTRSAEDKTLLEQFGGNRVKLAGGFGLTANPSPEAKGFVSGLRDEQMLDQAQQRIDKPTGRAVGGGSAWQQRVAEFDEINLIEDEAGRAAALQNYRDKWAPGTGFAASPESIDQAGKKAAARTGATIETQSRLQDVSAETAGTKKTAIDQAEIDRLYSDLDPAFRPTKKVSSNEADDLSLKAQGIAGAYLFKNVLESADSPGFWDLTVFGEFKNPVAKQGYEDMKESLARSNTGAAFTDSEDKRFEIQLGSKNFLTTEKGRAAVKESVQRFINRGEGAARVTWGNDGWMNNFGVKKIKVAYEALRDPDAPDEVIAAAKKLLGVK